jgi:hypothetical protein
MTNSEKVREDRLRRMAERRGLRLEKSRRRDPMAIDYGTFHLIEIASNSVASLGGGPLSIDDVERQLRGGNGFGRAEAGQQIDAEAGSYITVKPGAVLDIAVTGQHFIAQADGSLREIPADELADERGPEPVVRPGR